MEHKLIRWKELKSILGGASRSTVTRWESAGYFPPRLLIGPKSVAWRADEIAEWIESAVRR